MEALVKEIQSCGFEVGLFMCRFLKQIRLNRPPLHRKAEKTLPHNSVWIDLLYNQLGFVSLLYIHSVQLVLSQEGGKYVFDSTRRSLFNRPLCV